MTAIDTLRISKRLEATGLARDQAEALAFILDEGIEMAIQNLATKDDIARQVADNARASDALRQDFARAIESTVAKISAENRAALAEAANRQIIWSIGTLVGLAGLAIALRRLI